MAYTHLGVQTLNTHKKDCLCPKVEILFNGSMKCLLCLYLLIISSAMSN